MNEKPTIEIGKVPIITKFIYTLGVLPTSYLMCMTYEEQLVWLCNYIQTTLIPQINEDVEAIQELQNLYELLRIYVNDYFDNLDVQEEINNKLEEMISDGSLTEIIKNYIDPIINELEQKVDKLASGSPLVASSISGMTDTSRIYVNTSDGHWYWYNGTTWQDGGIYQATEDSNSVTLLEQEMKLVYAKYPYVFPTVTKGEPTLNEIGINTSVFRYSTEKIPVNSGDNIKFRFNNTTDKTFTLYMYVFNVNDECIAKTAYYEMPTNSVFSHDFTVATTGAKSVRFSGRSTDTVNLTSYYESISAGIKVTFIDAEKNILTDDKNTVYETIVDRIGHDESRIKNLENSYPTKYPSYYQAQLDSAVTKINANMDEVGQHGDTFVFITDTHWSNNTKHSPSLINFLKNKCNFRFVVHGGDYITGGTNISEWNENLRNARNEWNIFKNDFLTLFGNHDANNESGSQYRLDVNTVYDILFKRCEPSITEWNDKQVEENNPYTQFYYYVDNPITKTRNFYLCSSHGTIGDRQLNWLSSQLNNVPSGWHCIVFCHWIYNDGNYTGNGTQLKALCDQHTDKVMAIITGHVHYDKVDYTTAGIPIIFVTTDTHYPAQDEEGNTPDATVGTINEQAFDIITVNYSTGTVKCVRIGRGSDRTITSNVSV